MENSSNTYTEGGGSDSGLITEQVKQGTQQVVQGTQQAVSQVAEGAKQQAQSLLDRQKGQTTQTLHQVHTALTQTGESLRGQNQGAAAGLVEGAAGKLESVCQYVEGRSVSQLTGDLERFARSNAPIFLGGAFALGVLAARFLKSSTPQQPYAQYQQAGSYGSYGSYRDYAPTNEYAYGSSRGSYGGVPETTDVYPRGTSGFTPTGTEYSSDLGNDIELDRTGVNDGPTI